MDPVHCDDGDRYECAERDDRPDLELRLQERVTDDIPHRVHAGWQGECGEQRSKVRFHWLAAFIHTHRFYFSPGVGGAYASLALAWVTLISNSGYHADVSVSPVCRMSQSIHRLHPHPGPGVVEAATAHPAATQNLTLDPSLAALSVA